MAQRRDPRGDALRIWQAGVEAVRSERLVAQSLRVEGDSLTLVDEVLPLSEIRRIIVVGAGKAGAGMAAALEAQLGPKLLAEKNVTGIVHVPADCVRTLSRIRLVAARPAGQNEPTEAGVASTREILALVGSLTRSDLCLCLLSGGASALWPAPVEGISLADKLAVAKLLSGAGANIAELNTVRKQLSRIKGGGLARACRAGRLETLIISDVLGDPLDVIGSGPTVEDSATPQQALSVLRRFDPTLGNVPTGIIAHLEQSAAGRASRSRGAHACIVRNRVIGNNALAVDAAGAEAVRLGYSPTMIASRVLEGAADDLGEKLAREALAMRDDPRGPDCLISGGEPVVCLAPAESRGIGGRNQQLVLSAMRALWDDGARGIAILSGGTDGEDGPTDAAGAVFDEELLALARRRGMHPDEWLRRNDAYRYFEPLGGLVITGPTHTNVCDVRVAVVSKIAG